MPLDLIATTTGTTVAMNMPAMLVSTPTARRRCVPEPDSSAERRPYPPSDGASFGTAEMVTMNPTTKRAMPAATINLLCLGFEVVSFGRILLEVMLRMMPPDGFASRNHFR